MTEQRRLAAILVADVAGYSKLIGSDEAGTLAQLQALRTEVIEPQIAKHVGRLFKSVGDGFLIEFASAVDAVECAVAFQEVMADHNLDAIVHKAVEHQPTLIKDGIAPPFVDQKGAPHLNTFLVYVPTIVVPAGFTTDNLPAGLCFIGRPYDDGNLIKFAYAYEQATHHRKPPASTTASSRPRSRTPGAREPSRSGSRTRSSAGSMSSSWPTPRRPGRSTAGRSPSSRARSWTA